MKQLFIATGFAIIAVAGYTAGNGGYKGYASASTIGDYSTNDTTPRKKKDSTHKWGKDSLNKKDSTWPKKDTSGQHQ